MRRTTPAVLARRSPLRLEQWGIRPRDLRWWLEASRLANSDGDDDDVEWTCWVCGVGVYADQKTIKVQPRVQ